MNNIYGKLCPYCKSVMKYGEDIIVCSECNMPHHKECWIENKGCTTFGCLGTIDTPHISDEVDFELTLDDFDMVRCKKCGSLIEKNNHYCDHCGHSTSISLNLQKVHSDSDYYTDIFHRIEANNDWIYWNWSAFLLSHYWLIYRRMYFYGIASYVLILICAIVSIPLYVFISITMHVAFGTVGNMLYYRFCSKQDHRPEEKSENKNITLAICLAVIFMMIIVARIQ